jgi:excisionase family DNA binding protein
LPDWITTQEAAELSGFHPEYVRRLARQGKIGAEKKGRDWWIDRDVLHAYLQTVEDLGPQKFDPRGSVMPGDNPKQELKAQDRR